MNLGAEALASMELFVGLPSAVLDEVMKRGRVRHLQKETRIFHQGDPADRAHALIEGTVRISQTGDEGAQILIRLIGPGETFGTAALFTDRKYPADAHTLSDAVEISWSEAALLDLIARYPRIALNVIRVLGVRLKEAQERLRELSTQRVERRIARTVLRLAGKSGQPIGNATEIDFPLRRRDVAQMSGTTLYTVSRTLKAWERAGWLTSEKQRLVLRRESEIQRIADDPME
jgi:CRP-like cAMP-binding protein